MSILPDHLAPLIKLWDPDAEPFELAEAGAPPRLSAAMSLTQFFERWYCPCVLEAKGDEQETIDNYRNALHYWREITGDPQLKQIDDYTLSTFLRGLESATYQRGKLGPPIPLSRETQRKHYSAIMRIYFLTGSGDWKRRGKRLVEEMAYVAPPKAPKRRPKPCFTLEQARAVIGAAAEMERPQILGIRAGDWWRAFLALAFYTGLRSGCLLQLRWTMIDLEGPIPWLSVPSYYTPPSGGRIKMDKNGAHHEVALPPQAVEALRAIRREGTQPHDRVFPLPHHERTLKDLHKDLQGLAGIPAAKRMRLHAWRATHGVEIGRVPGAEALRVAQEALGHESAETTRSSYVDPTNELRLKMPRLWDWQPKRTGDDPRQKKLF